MAKILVLVLTIIVFALEHWQKTPEEEAWKDVSDFDKALASGDVDRLAVMLRNLDRLPNHQGHQGNR